MAKVAEVACQKGMEGVDFEMNSTVIWSNTYVLYCGFVAFMFFLRNLVTKRLFSD